MSQSPPPPTLPEVHTGAPPRLAEIARQTKAKFYQDRTLRDDLPRQPDIDGHLPVLPPDISRETFNGAITELKKSLGDTNVILNDKSLNDGWYLEHP